MANVSVTKVNGQCHSDVEPDHESAVQVPKENGHHEEVVTDSDEEAANEEIPKIIYIDRRKLMKAKKLISAVTLESIEEEEEDDSDSEGEREWRREDEEDRAGFEIEVIDYIEDEVERRTLVCYI